MRPLPALLLVLPLLTGCLSMGEAPVPGGIYRLQPPSEGPRFEEWVMVRVESPGKTQDFIVQASNDGLRQDYALLDPVGMVTLLAGSYDGQTVMSSGPLAEAVPAALPLAAIQLVRWPLDSLRTGLPAPLLVSGDGKRNRFLSKDGRTVLVATLGETTVIQRPDPPLRIVVRRAQQR